MQTIELATHEMQTALEHAVYNITEGIGVRPSSVHNGRKRQQRIGIDQAVGQVATAAYCKYQYGDIQQYQITRFYRNQNPDRPDYGFDLGGLNVDVKGSFMRGSSNPKHYNLYAKPWDLRPDWIFVSVLIQGYEDYSKWVETPPIIYLAGYAMSEEMAQAEKWRGSYKLPVTELHPLPPIRYHHNERLDIGAHNRSYLL